MSRISRCFISCVTAEFRTYRDDLRRHLTNSVREVKIQEDFTQGGTTVLEKLDDYIRSSNAVIHLLGRSAGKPAMPAEVRAILKRYPDLAAELKELDFELHADTCPFTYTQWECYLSIYHCVPCFIYAANDDSVRESGWIESQSEIDSQASHLRRLRAIGWEVGDTFSDARDVALKFLCSFDESSEHSRGPAARRRRAPAWPSIGTQEHNRVPRLLANRDKELEVYSRFLSQHSSHRILLIHGPTNRGKSTLIAEYERHTHLLGSAVVSSLVQLRGRRSYQEVVRFIWMRIRNVASLETVNGDLGVTVSDAMEKSRRPIVLLFDSFDEAIDETRRWIEEHLFDIAARCPWVRIVVAGRSLPTNPNAQWSNVAQTQELHPIMDTKAWCRYLRDKLGVMNVPDDHVQTLVDAARGEPEFLDRLLSNLKERPGRDSTARTECRVFG